MRDVNEEIVRLYFEGNGFLVRTNVPYYVRKNDRGPGGRSDIDLIVANMNHSEKDNLPFVLTNDDVKGINKAAIEVKGWHTETISPATNNFERLTYITREEAVNAVEEVFGKCRFKKILIIPSLAPRRRAETIDKLRSFGIDHVIEFKTIMDKLYNSTNTKENPSSAVLQTIRLMKIYKSGDIDT